MMNRILGIITGLIFFSLMIFYLTPPSRKSLYPEFNSFDITDRNGILLRRVLSKDYKTSIWKNIKDISPDMIKATILREDKRFFSHNGVDIIALFRSLFENIKYRKIHSGGSTITMQVAKLVLNNKERNIINKIIEILYAFKIEFHLSKEKILEIYLNRAPYGYQTYGVEAASRFYFNKSANQLSLSEAIILSIIPKSPGILNPKRKYDTLLRERNRILKNLLTKGFIDSTKYYCALNEPVKIEKEKIMFKAPHFVDFVLQNGNYCSNITSTIDINLQENIERILLTSINTLSKFNVNQGAVLVMDTKTGEILGMVGSKDYFDEREGQVNGCTALRQPGSSLKPFLYLLALTSGIPMSYLMNDTITEFRLSDGTLFAPRNYGDKYHRLVRAREALGSSFNVPAVYILDKIGVEKFHTFLTSLHFTTLFKNPNFYGLSLSLGAAEVKLIELVNAYRAIANKGMWTEYKFIKDRKPDRAGKGIFSEEVAYIITDVLSDNSSRIKAFGDDSPLNLPFPCAVKTGTTKDFKDNWCVGFTEKYTVGVWVGNFDGSPMNGVSGISGAAPLFRTLMIELHRDEYPKDFEKPKILVHAKICAKTGMIAGRGCSVIEEIYTSGTEPKDTCLCCEMKTTVSVPVNNNTSEFRILHPQNGDIFKLDPHIPYKNQAIAIRVVRDTSITSYTLYLNSKILCQNEPNFLWQPVPGRYELEAKAQSKSKIYKEKISFTVY